MNLTEARRLAAKAKREQFERLFAHQCAVVGIAAPIPQYRFARDLGRFWTADFAWPDLFAGVTTAEDRRERVRRAILDGGKSEAVAGRRPGYGCETWRETFERVYGQPLGQREAA